MRALRLGHLHAIPISMLAAGPFVPMLFSPCLARKQDSMPTYHLALGLDSSSDPSNSPRVILMSGSLCLRRGSPQSKYRTLE